VGVGDTPPRKLRVLVVDDDEDIRQVVGFTLRKLPLALDVVMATDGQDAVEKAEAAPPDLVILDVMMPRMDGFQTCERLRQNVRTAFVPILMLTASADESSRTKGYLVGTDDYMSKPFLPPDLNLRVTRLLRRTYGI
jgi:DNA-binding response OmpR family regulator